MRTKKEKIIDILLELKAIQTASTKTSFRGVLMLQKIMFLSGYKYWEDKIRALNQTFYRWDYGPMSDEVYADFTTMQNLDLIEGERAVRVTEHGKKILDYASPFFEENKKLAETTEKTAEEVEDLDTLMDKVYDKDVYVEEMDEVIKMEKVPLGMHILTPPWRDESIATLDISNALLETLDLMIEPTIHKEILKSIDDAKQGRISPLEL